MGVRRTRGEKSTRRYCTLALSLVPLDGSQHPTLGFPHAVDSFGGLCDGGHSDLRWLVVLVVPR